MSSVLTIGPDGYAIPAADLLADQLTDCGFDDPEWDAPERWLAWTDADRWELPGPDDDQADGEDLARDWEPDPAPDQADRDWLADLDERRAYERGCNARWA